MNSFIDGNLIYFNINNALEINHNFVNKNLPIKNWNFVHEETVFINEELEKSVVDNEDEILEKEYITAMEGIPDLGILVTGNISGEIKFWKLKLNGEDINNQEFLINPKLHEGRVHTITYITSESDKKLIFTGGEDLNLNVIIINEEQYWEVKQFNKFPINRLSHLGDITGNINSICNIFDGKHLVYNIGSKIAVFNINNMEIENIKEFQPDVINNMFYINDLKLLVYTTNNIIKAFNPIDSDFTYTFPIESPISNLIHCMFNNQHYFIGSHNDNIFYYSFTNGEFKKVKNYKMIGGTIEKLIYCYDNRTFVIILKEGIFFLQNIENENIKKRLFYDQSPFTCGCYLGDSSTLAFATSEGKIDFFKCY